MASAAERQPWLLALARRLGSPPPRRLPPSEARQAAVLVPLFVDASELWTILVKRTEHLRHHRSQIAFPGGSREMGEDPWQAALRETHEEIGLEPGKVLPLGQLDEAEVPSGFRVVPCVGAVPAGFAPRPDRGEIAEVFRMPLQAFANPRAVEEREVAVDGVPRSLLIYHIGSRQIWGVTARILQNLLVRAGLESGEEN